MSSGTQVDLDWAGMDSAPSGAGVSPAPKNEGPAAGNDATGTAYLTDEEILGIDPGAGDNAPVILSEAKNPSDGFADGVEDLRRDSSGANRPHLAKSARREQNENDVDRAHGEPHENAVTASRAEMPAWMAAAAGDPQHSAEAQALWREHQEFRAAFRSPEEARAVKELLPGGLRDALSLREATQSIERIDAALFSGDARAQAEVVAEIARANPAAFRTLFAEAAKVLAESGTGGRETDGKETRISNGSDSSGLSVGPTLRTNREGWGTQNSEDRRGGDGRQRDHDHNRRPDDDRDIDRDRDRRDWSHRDRDGRPPGSSTGSSTSSSQGNDPPPGDPDMSGGSATGARPSTFDPTAYAAFERATNDTVARDVRGSIHAALARVLPEGVAEGAARRIGEDIFHEVHRALAADRSLSEQVAGVLRERRFGSAEQQRVAALLAGRARQMVPGVARRVIGEWTSTVLNTARTKAARQAAAASRVDIASPGGSLDSTPMRSRAAGSREVDYAGMSDEQILGI